MNICAYECSIRLTSGQVSWKGRKTGPKSFFQSVFNISEIARKVYSNTYLFVAVKGFGNLKLKKNVLRL